LFSLFYFPKDFFFFKDPLTALLGMTRLIFFKDHLIALLGMTRLIFFKDHLIALLGMTRLSLLSQRPSYPGDDTFEFAFSKTILSLYWG